MKVEDVRVILTRLLSTSAIVLISICVLVAPTASAQEDDADRQAAEQYDDEDEATEEIVVTGSRLKRDTYSSISPLQIISAQVSREVGLIDAADILQESSASSGQQIDLTFQGFVLDNGPGSSTINLRGLGEARTLVLMNGRRLAPAGVEGAPFAANLNQVPASMVQQYEILLDGASSVYGSDAIAGVANVILRKDFDGLEIEGFSRVPEYSSGVDHTVSVVWGKNFDRGFIGFGGEYTQSERVSLEDRPWTAGCEQHHEIDENGEFRFQEVYQRDILGMAWDECRLDRTAGRYSAPFIGSVYYTGPGTSNGGWGAFSASRPRTDMNYTDSNGDGISDVSFRDFDRNGTAESQASDLFPETSSHSFMAYGEYTFDSEWNITPYIETMYNSFDFESRGRPPQLFPTVPALNPYNPCNPAAAGGTDCGLAWNVLMENPAVIQQYLDTFGCSPNVGGTCPQTRAAAGPRSVLAIVGVRGDRDNTITSGDQLRVVGGVRGDLPFMNFGSMENWSFDIYTSITESDAVSERRGIREDRLDLALGQYSLTNTPCEANNPNAFGLRTGITIADFQPDVIPGCVPVNLFAPSLYENGYLGDLATQAERDYIFDGRNFDTKYKQTIISAYVTGDLFEMPAGTVALGFGAEHRNDDIKSIPDAVARDGLFFGFFSDGGATGDKDTDELFAEVEIPLLAGVRAFEELTLNLSTRYTDDEIYGSNTTESYKLGWRPIDSLLIRGTYGTSFRAPNLRELYLQAQSGFGSIFDPCFNDADSWDITTNTYVPAGDDREPQVLANCLAQGVDPTLAYSPNGGGIQTFSTEVASGGALDLNAETSESWSAGFSWDQPFSNAFGLSLGATYYEIEVNQTIIEPSGQFIVNDCLNSLTGNSVFCSRITRDLSDPGNPRITLIDSGFINREAEKARGVDVNLAFDDSFTIFDRPIDVRWDVTANRQLERSTLFLDDLGNADTDTFQGEWGFPDWNVRSGLRFDYDDWRFTWETRYLASVHQDPDGVDDFSDANILSDTCFGPPDDVLCRDYGDADNYFLHHFSVYYYGDRWTVGGGIRNAFDKNPPIVDGTEILSLNNTPIGYGYDVNGRVFFLNVGIDFGGGE